MSNREKPYELINHTADIGIRVLNETLEGLFEQAAFALFDNLAELKNVKEGVYHEIQVTGMDLPELMVNWLNQLLFLWETRLVLFRRFHIHKVNQTAMQARAWGEKYDPDLHELLGDIKAATYHNLRIEQHQGLWSAEIIFDT
jgi:SHS2 domain-containing protein